MEMEAHSEDDGRIRTGTIGTATAHAFTAVVGAGILALPWSVGELGWIFGCFVLLFFAFITYYTAILLCDCYRTPDPISGRRNYTYIDAVRALLGPRYEFVCAMLQYTLLWGTMIGYTVTAAISVAAVKRTTCFHAKGNSGNCGVSGNVYMVIYGGIQIFLSQCPNLEKVAFISVIASITSLVYGIIALCLSIEKLSSNHEFKGSLMLDMSGNEAASTKIWHYFQALGNIAFSYSFSMLLLEIQDTLKPHPPENKVMKRVTLYAIFGTALFYISLGCIGYAAFGNDSPGNVLSGFYQPFWLVDIANLSVIIHLIGAYQVFGQPIFAINERIFASRWPNSMSTTTYTIKLPYTNKCGFKFRLHRLFLRTVFVVLTTAIGMMLPFFNAILGFLGAISFWPLSVYFPLSMYMVQTKVKKGSPRWICFQALSLVCMIVTLVSGIGSAAGVLESLNKAKLFHIQL